MAMIGSYCELSVIVIDLGRESVVCLDNHTQWLRRLYVLNFVLLLHVCGIWGAEDSPLQPSILEEAMEHQRRMLIWISSYRYNYTMEEETCFHAYFGYIQCHVLLLDESHVPLITIETNATYHFPFERTPQNDINHIISYYAYLGFVWPDNSLWFSQQFIGDDANGDLLDCWDITLKSTRMWEILATMRISCRPRSLSTGMFAMRRYSREIWFHMMRNEIPRETKAILLKIWLRPR